MGVMLSVLVAGVGAMDLIYCLAYVSNQVAEPSNAIEDAKQIEDSGQAGLEQYRESVRQQIKEAPRSTVEGVTYAQDGVPYKDGYRLEPGDGGAQLDELIEKLRVLERQSQEKEHQLEQMSVQMSELERSATEQSLIIERLRSRSVSPAPNRKPSGGRRTDLSPADSVPQIVLNEPNDSGGGADEPRPSSSKFRPIRRDDGLRRSVKRRSVTSTASLEDRSDELDRLSQLEDEESARMDDYIPIVYSRDEQDPMNRRHNISPIPESCHHHEDDERQWVPERSPEPTLAANITRPWGDIKLGEIKENAVIRPARSMSIEEEDIEAPATAVQLHVSESRPSNLSSHSNTPERERAEPEPTLRRTTKEADLTSLLLQPGAPECQGDLLSGGVSASARGVTPAGQSQAERLLSPLAALEVDAGTEGDTEGESDQLLAVPGSSVRSKSSGSSLSPSPRRKHKERKRVPRSLTPIDYDQTFMDSFSEQHLSVTPSELEDYINSMEEIQFVPPPLVKPSYLYPLAPPSLVLTDELGTDAQFHDELSSKSFYGQSHSHAGVTLNHRVNYTEWIRKFPENQTSHLALEDFDSDDEEVENIICRAQSTEQLVPLFPTDVPASAGNSPQPSKPEIPKTPEHAGKATNDERTEFPINITPGYATPSPVSLVSDLSELSSQSSHASQPSQTPTTSSFAIGSPLLNSCTNNNPPEHHFTPIVSLSELSIGSDTQLSSLQSPRLLSPQTAQTPAMRPTLSIPGTASRTPSVSPLPLDISPEEEVFEIGHLDGLIFEAKSREPTPSRTPSRNEQLPLLSPDELAFDIGNMGGLIMGAPSRGASPIPPA